MACDDDWPPGPGDTAYRRYTVTSSRPDLQTVASGGEGAASPDPPPMETTDVWLSVLVLGEAGPAEYEVSQFGERHAVGLGCLSSRPHGDLEVFPAGPGSPYTGINDVSEELIHR